MAAHLGAALARVLAAASNPLPPLLRSRGRNGAKSVGNGRRAPEVKKMTALRSGAPGGRTK